ncbi:MAG: aminoacyl-tRNA hydrolase [Chitinophagales bacterium]|nr:aminoacyl-tRNA hydrolase [Chitinophagales bacterium]
MKYLIVGLGNIGDQYAHTRHNIGFDVLDTLIKRDGNQFFMDRLAEIAEYKYKGKSFHLIKPTTFMNLSGRAVRYWMQQLKIEIKDTLIITDDIALPLGKLRLRPKGSDGGHNGLKNINELLETQEYPRLRFGVGNNFGKGQQVQFVLGKWKPEEMPLVEKGIDDAIEIIHAFGTIGLERAMNLFNK